MNKHELQTRILNKQKSRVLRLLLRLSWLWHIFVMCFMIFLLMKNNNLSTQLHTQAQQIQQLNNQILDFDDKIVNLEKQVQFSLQQDKTLPQWIDKNSQDIYIKYLTQQLKMVDEFVKSKEFSHAKVLLVTLHHQIDEQNLHIMPTLRAELRTYLQQDIEKIQYLQTNAQSDEVAGQEVYQTQTGWFLANQR